VVPPLIFCGAAAAAAAGRLILRFGFRPTARFGAALAVLGMAGLLAGALLDAGVAWISAACAVVGLGLGPSSLAQVLAIQQVAAERHRGVATSLVPFFRTVGGSLGVGALGGVLTAGLAARLGSGLETASRLLAGPRENLAPGASPLDPALFRDAIERSLLPVFGVLLVLSAANLFVAGRFPEADASGPPEAAAAEIA
jgi:MFS family permease